MAMTKPDYTALDAAILAVITAAPPATFQAINTDRGVLEHSSRLAAATRDTPEWRMVDRRLQAMRKASRIRYQRKPEGWVLVDKTPQAPSA